MLDDFENIKFKESSKQGASKLAAVFSFPLGIYLFKESSKQGASKQE